MVPILVEPAYSNSVWCVSLLEGLTGEFKQKRIPFCRIDALEEVPPGEQYLYLIGSDAEWVKAALTACNRFGIYPILLCNQSYHTFDADYSAVCSDVMNSTRRLVELLHQRGCHRIALYGVNPKSVSDESRKESYLTALQGAAGEQDVFYNSGSLENCFGSFCPHLDDYDAVICANDFAAISLVRRLGQSHPEQLDRLAVAGCADTRLTQLYGAQILSVRVNFAEYGRAAVMLMDALRKNPYLSHVVMMIRWDVDAKQEPARASSAPGRPSLPQSALPAAQDVFYDDEELTEMMLLEKLLSEAEDLDRRIIGLLLEGAAYERISEECFLTESAIKYRVKKMVKICHVKGRAELTGLLRRYLPPRPAGD